MAAAVSQPEHHSSLLIGLILAGRPGDYTRALQRQVEVQQGADPDPRIRMDEGQVKPAPRREELAIQAQADLYQGRYRSFPIGAQWEVNDVHAWGWFAHRFRNLLSSENFLSRVDVANDELLLLVYDLDLYETWCVRYLQAAGPCPPPIGDYLRPGREHWGRTWWEHVTELLREGDDG